MRCAWLRAGPYSARAGRCRSAGQALYGAGHIAPANTRPWQNKKNPLPRHDLPATPSPCSQCRSCLQQVLP